MSNDTTEIAEESRIGFGEFDWILAKDEDGNVWVRPSEDWGEDVVAGAMHDGQLLYNLINGRIDNSISTRSPYPRSNFYG